MKDKRAPETLPESASILLDAIRFSAAIMVAVAHFSHAEFHMGYVDREVLGDIAVPVFFVLSGLVIRYVTRTRELTATQYFIDRASRIYSVVLPALFFTLAVSGACFLLDRQQFLRDWSSTFGHPFVRIVFNLLFVSQAWGLNTFPFINSPFWSLGYECIYYLLYGFLFFVRGWKRAMLCAAVAVAIGPQVLLLLPIWWLGCWVYDFYLRFRRTRIATFTLAASAVWFIVGTILFLAGQRSMLLAPYSAFQAVLHLKNPIELLGMPPRRATMFALATGVLSSIILLLFLLAVDSLEISRSNPWARGFRHLADGTFTIYLMHYPFLLLLFYLGWLRPGHTQINLLAFVGMCAVLVAVAIPIDKFKFVIRRWLRRHFAEDSRGATCDAGS